jgi:hypothetical protein
MKRMLFPTVQKNTSHVELEATWPHLLLDQTLTLCILGGHEDHLLGAICIKVEGSQKLEKELQPLNKASGLPPVLFWVISRDIKAPILGEKEIATDLTSTHLESDGGIQWRATENIDCVQ